MMQMMRKYASWRLVRRGKPLRQFDTLFTTILMLRGADTRTELRTRDWSVLSPAIDRRPEEKCSTEIKSVG